MECFCRAFQKLQEIASCMHILSTGATSVNEEFNEERWIPMNFSPCEECLFMHVFRANYHQASVWRCCLQRRPFVPSPKGNDGHNL